MSHVRPRAWCALVAAYLCVAGSAWGFGPLYLRTGRALSIAAPVATEPRDDVSTFVGAGKRAVLAEFRSNPVAERVDAASAAAILYLVTGPLGMENCAVVTAEVSRRSPLDERTVVGSGSLTTSILPRRQTVEPIVVTVPVTGPLALPKDQIALSIGIENRCREGRNVALRYDALGWVSAVRIDGGSQQPPATTTTTTTTTTVTTTPAPLPTTTTTTLPYPFGCLFQPLEGYEAVFCRLDTLGEVLVEEGPSSVGGVAAYGRLRRRLEQTRDRVSLALSGKRVPRNLRRAGQQLGVFGRLVRRGGRQGLIDPDLGEELSGLTAAAAAQSGTLPRR
jgi:hypothetical protein